MEKYVITGGPSVGKSTLCDQLGARGYEVVKEASTIIIEEEVAKEKVSPGYAGILPWTNQREFEQLVIKKQLDLESKIGTDADKVFMDRCLVDNLAYAELTSFDLLGQLKPLIKDAGYTRVFFLERLPFYENSAVRKETEGKGRIIHEKIYEIYDKLGFDIVKVPSVSKEERLAFILNEIPSKKRREIENKYRANHGEVRSKLAHYQVELKSIVDESNKLYDFFGLLRKGGYTLRLRDAGEHYLTFKGKDKGEDVKDKMEIELRIHPTLFSILQKILPEDLFYLKKRETHIPLGDPNCKICLDTLPGLGDFVEVEAKTRNQVLLWEKRLGLTMPIKEGYPSLVRNFGKK